MKYQRQPTTSSGTAISTAGASGGAVTASPPSSSAAHTTPIASCGTASRIALASRSMSVVIRDSRSPVPGPLQDTRRQPDRPYEEVLAQVGQHPLAEHRAAQPHLPDEHGLYGQRDDEQPDGAAQMEVTRAVRRRLDEIAQQVGADHRGDHGDRVDRDEQVKAGGAAGTVRVT